MQLTFRAWWLTTKNYASSLKKIFKGAKSGWPKVLTFVFALVAFIVGMASLTFTFIFFWIIRELGRLIIYLIKRGTRKILNSPETAIWGAMGIVVVLVTMSVIHNVDLQTSFRYSAPTVVEDTPRISTGRSNGKSLSNVQKDWNDLYAHHSKFRKIADHINEKLGIDGRKFFAALDFNESGGDGYIIGDRGYDQSAYGRLQIRQVALDDLQKLGNYHRLDDIVGNKPQDLINSARAFELYTSLYILPGEERNLNAYLNTWNGGPSGTPKDTQYTKRVRLILKRIK